MGMVRVHSRRGMFVLAVTLSVAAATASQAMGANVEFQFTGVMTSVSAAGSPAWTPPALFSSAQVGDVWTLRYIFDDARAPTSGSVFIGALKQFQLTIGAASLTLPPTPVGSFGTVTMGAFGGHQYDVAIPLQAPGGIQPSVGVVLNDPSATALSRFDRMPSELSLSAFSNRFFFLGPLNAQNQFRGTVTGFVPSPSGGAAGVLLGLAALRRARRA